MASTYSDLKIELIGTGDQSGTWGATTNTNLGTALEEAIVGRATANFTTDADLTITLSNVNTTQVARNYILNVTSGVALTATRNLIVPTIDKPYIVENNTTGSQSIVVKTSAGTGITVPTGKTVMVYANGTNVVQAFDYVPSVTVGTVNITSLTAGSITDSALTSGRVPYASTAGLIIDSASLTFDGTTLSTTTVDATNLEVTNLKAKDGTAAGSIANSTGVVTIASSVLTTTDINGGTIDATAIGGSTPAAGAFTSGSFSTTLGVTGVATLTAQPILSSLTASSAVATDASKGLVSVTNTGTGNNVLATSPTITGATLTTAALNGSLGATTPSTIAATTISASGVSTFSAGTAGAPAITTTGDTNTGMFFPAADTIAFSEGGVEAMRIDSSGNVGLGVTPNTAYTANNYRALQLTNGALLHGQTAGGTPLTGLSSNFYANAAGADTYIASAFATQYRQWNGAHQWLTAPSGTAGNAITFTQAMTLNAAGNVGIGTTSPGNKLNVSAAGASGVEFNPTRRDGGADGAFMLSYNRNTSAYQQFEYDALLHRFETSGTERMRLHASGGLSLGNTTDGGAGVLNVNASVVAPFAKLTANGTGSSNAGLLLDYSGVVQWQIYPETTTGTLTVSSAGTTRLKLDSSGNLGLGVTPSAWYTGASAKALQISTYGALWSTNANIRLNGNVYYNSVGGAVYLNTGAASEYIQDAGAHTWKTVASGTAGTGIAGGTYAWTTAMTLDASGGLKLGNTIGVGNATPSTSGAGITFPATQSASSDANTLDDYEEGSWTPTDASGAALSFTIAYANYVKVGKLVTINVFLTFPSTVDVNNVAMSGLPFTVASNNYPPLTIVTNSGVALSCYANAATTTLSFGLAINYSTSITNASMSGKGMIISGTYMAN